MAASAEISGAEEPAVELIVYDAAAPPASPARSGDEMAPLLKPKINIFSPSFSRRRPREQALKFQETETSVVAHLAVWLWSGSRYSGLLCVALSSAIYFAMEVISDAFSAQQIPLYESAFARCTVILISSYLWLRRTGQPLFGPAQARILLLSRAFVGFLSLLSFIYCIQRLPLSQAIVLSFTAPIMGSVVARITLHEKLKISEIGGLACSFFGVLFIFRQIFATQGLLSRASETKYPTLVGSQHVYAVMVGLLSSITGGVTYWLIKAGAKAADQPVTTVLSFGVLGSLAALVCAFTLEELVLPDVYSLFLMLTLGILAFLAQVLLARGLYLEKINRAANMLYIEAALSQIWGICSSRVAPSFGGLIGCLLIFVSVCCTIYFGPDKETE